MTSIKRGMWDSVYDAFQTFTEQEAANTITKKCAEYESIEIEPAERVSLVIDEHVSKCEQSELFVHNKSCLVYPSIVYTHGASSLLFHPTPLFFFHLSLVVLLVLSFPKGTSLIPHSFTIFFNSIENPKRMFFVKELSNARYKIALEAISIITLGSLKNIDHLDSK